MLLPSFNTKPLKENLSDILHRRRSSNATISPEQSNKWFNRRRSEPEFEEDSNELDLDEGNEEGGRGMDLDRRGSDFSQISESDQWYKVQHRYLPIGK